MSNTRRIGELDSVRGIASLTVVIHHCLIAFPIFLAAHFHEKVQNTIVKILSYTPIHTIWAGHEAVLLFFVLSGFVLSLPYLKEGSLRYPEYLVKRFCRIYIPYLAAIVLSILLFFILGGNGMKTLSTWFNDMWSHSISFKSAISYLFMLGNDTHNVDTATWSLVHEMRISIIFPIIMLMVKEAEWDKALTIGLTLSFSMWYLSGKLSAHVDSNTIKLLILSFGDTFYYSSFFVVGALLAKYRSNISSFFNHIKYKGRVVLFTCAILLYTVEWIIPKAGYLKYHGGSLGAFSDKMIDWVIISGVVIMLVFAQESQKAKQILGNAFFMWLGKISYSLYLVHAIVLLTMVYTLGRVLYLPITIFLVPFVSLIVASVFYKFVERPSISLGRRLSDKMKANNHFFSQKVKTSIGDEN